MDDARRADRHHAFSGAEGNRSTSTSVSIFKSVNHRRARDQPQMVVFFIQKNKINNILLFWQRVVEDVRTIIREYDGYIYIPDLRPVK